MEPNTEVEKGTAEKIEEGLNATPADKQVKEPENKGVPADPEIEIEGKKVKLSEVKTWQKSHADYSTKSNELAEKEKSVQELVQLSEMLAQNPKKLEKVLKVLQEKEDAGEITEKQANLKEILSTLSDDDPSHQVLKALAQEIVGIKENVKYFRDLKAREDEDAQVETASGVLNKTMEDFQKSANLKNEHETKLFRQLVLSYLKDNPKEYNNSEEFVSEIKRVSEMHFGTIKSIREGVQKEVLESKRGTPPITGGDGSKKEDAVTKDNLQASIEKELELLETT